MTFPWLVYSSSFSILLPFITGLIFYRNQSRAIRFFFVLICISVATEASLNYLAEKGINNHAIINGYPALEMVFFCMFFRELFQEKRIRNLIIAGMAVLLVYWFVSAFINGFGFLNKYNLIFERLLLITLAGSHLLKTIQQTDHPPLHLASFRISAGAFIYFASTIILFSFAQLLQNEDLRNIHKYMSAFHAIINIFSNLIYSSAFCARYRE